MNEKQRIYDDLSLVLTRYECGVYKNSKEREKALYTMLVEIQNRWEDVITVVE